MLKAHRSFIYCLRVVRVEESWDVIARFHISCLQGMACEVIDWKDPSQVGGFLSVGCEYAHVCSLVEGQPMAGSER